MSRWSWWRSTVLVLVLPVGCSLNLEVVSRVDASVTSDLGAADSVVMDASDRASDGTDATEVADVAIDGCIRTVEVCDGVDNDCNGLTDESLAPLSCGAGLCAVTTPACVDGVPQTCVSAPPRIETCNGFDDDCNGLVDDGIPIPSCGIGACARVAPVACTGNMPTVCSPGTPASFDTCGDGIDNDCNGAVDDNPACCDRYVLAGSSTANDGLGVQTPMATIQAAIDSMALAGTTGEVCVAGTTSGGAGCVAQYVENVTVHEGVSVLGGFDSSFTGRRCVTRIVSLSEWGVAFPRDVTNATQLDGFELNPVGPAPAGTLPPAQTAVVTMFAGGVLSNNTILPGGATRTIGVNLMGVPGANPTPLIVRNTIRSAPNNLRGAEFIAIAGTSSSPEIRGNPMIAAGDATMLSVAVSIADGPDTLVVDNRDISAGSASTAAGLVFRRNVSNVLVTRNQITGSRAIAIATTTGAPARGVGFEACTGAGGRVFDNDLIVGSATVSSAFGVDVTAGCDVTIDANARIVGKTIAGLEGMGVRCNGLGAQCTIVANGALAGYGISATSGARGVGAAYMAGAGGLVADNRGVIGCEAGSVPVCHGLLLDGAAAGTVASGNSIVANSGAWTTGILTRGSTVEIFDNFVSVNGANGIVLDVRAGVASEPKVHSNTVIGGVHPATNLIVISNETVAGTPTGILRNNNLFCVSVSTPAGRFAIHEFGMFADPRVLENNNLFGCEVLYADADTSTAGMLTSIAAVNALSDIPNTAGNLSLDPMLVSSTDPHLQPGSPVIDQGTRNEWAPARDFDNDPRPLRGGYDIGCDEVP